MISHSHVIEKERKRLSQVQEKQDQLEEVYTVYQTHPTLKNLLHYYGTCQRFDVFSSFGLSMEEQRELRTFYQEIWNRIQQKMEEGMKPWSFRLEKRGELSEFAVYCQDFLIGQIYLHQRPQYQFSQWDRLTYQWEEDLAYYEKKYQTLADFKTRHARLFHLKHWILTRTGTKKFLQEVYGRGFEEGLNIEQIPHLYVQMECYQKEITNLKYIQEHLDYLEEGIREFSSFLEKESIRKVSWWKPKQRKVIR